MPSTPPSANRAREWTIVHSYFTEMGGFAVQLDDDCNFFPRKSFGDKKKVERLTLTAEGLRFLDEMTNRDRRAQGSIIPDLSLTQIEDKGNASILAKSLVCIQGQYFDLARPLCIYILSHVIPKRLIVVLLPLISNMVLRPMPHEILPTPSDQLARAQHVWTRRLHLVYLRPMVAQAARHRGAGCHLGSQRSTGRT